MPLVQDTSSIIEDEKSLTQNRYYQSSLKENDTSYSEEKPESMVFISFNEAWRYFNSLSFETERQQIIRTDDRNIGCCSKMLRCFIKSAKLKSILEEERDKILCIAKTGYDSTNNIHERMMKTIYYKLTDTPNNNLALIDWVSIGFQGDNPATDLRGVGMLGPLNLNYFIDNHLSHAKQCYSISTSPTHNFPFACASLAITKITIESLREGKLFKLANKENSVIKIVTHS